MNIFVLDYDPKKAAQMQCDKHVVKMPLESAQILCSVFKPNSAPYRRTHYNHPCSIWARRSQENYVWLINHGLFLCDEYQYRYGKVHKSKNVILWCLKNIKKIDFNYQGKSKFVLCFDDKYKIGNAVISYRLYYRQEKARIATWKRRNPPEWFTRE